MLLLVVGGIVTLPTLRQEMLPDISLDIVTVQVAYPGASPEEVEEALCVPIEEEIQDLQGVKRIRSTAIEGMGSVTIELMGGEDVGRRLADVRARVDSIDSLPDEAERPVVSQVEVGRQVLSVAISGPADEWTLKRIGEQVRDELSALPQISQVTLSSVRPYEISIEVSESALLGYGIRFDDVVSAVRSSSLDLPGGSIKASGGEVLLRARGKAYDRRAFEQIALVARADGTRLTLGDVATVVDGFAETDQRSFFDGEPSVLVQVFRVGDQRVLEVAAAAEAYVEEARHRLPEGIQLTIWQNSANLLADRIGSMLQNARSGFILVILVLALFLRLRLALWVGLGIPIAFLGSIALLPGLGVSINWISLLGFIIVLGIVVDDAIVVGENTHSHQQRSGRKLEGAIRGAQTIAVPVCFGVFTTVAAFAPMLFIPGSMGRLVRVVPIVVIVCLTLSLIEAMFVLPAHLGQGRRSLDDTPTNPVSRSWRLLQDRVAAALDGFIRDTYRPLLERALEWRYLTLAIALSVLLFTYGLLAGGWLRFTFQEPVEGDTIAADLTMPLGTPAEVTAQAMLQLEAAARAIQQEADAERDTVNGSIFSHVLTSLGEQPFAASQGPIPKARDTVGSGAHLGEVQVEMTAPEFRDVGTEEMQRRWRERVGDIAGAVELSFRNSLLRVGAPIELELRGPDLLQLREAAATLRRRLGEYPGVYDISDSFRGGKQELEFQIRPSAETLGLTQADVARQVRQAFYGDEAQRLQRGRDEVKVMVRYPPERRRSLRDVEGMRLRTPDGSEVPFSSVASVSMARGFSSIQRVDRQRVVTVTADVDVAVGNSNEIIADLESQVLPEVLSVYPGVHYSFEGEQAEQRGFLSAMLRGQIIALLVIYGLMAIPLRSYAQPLVIMSAIPFGLVGAAWGHVLMGYEFSMYSVVGFVALSGIVVNASLVLVDYANGLHAQGLPLERAILEAATARLRAIMLTSLTTFVGLTPMMLEDSLSARFMVPMAVALAFGVLFASLITLFLVPCTTLIFDDVQRWLRSEESLPEATSPVP